MGLYSSTCLPHNLHNLHNLERATSMRFNRPVYFKNGFGTDFDYLLNFINQSAKPTDLKMIFSVFFLYI